MENRAKTATKKPQANDIRQMQQPNQRGKPTATPNLQQPN
jgi:hypothetical protein